MIGYCTTCKNRTPHLERTLSLNLSYTSVDDTKIILLNYNSQDNLVEYLQQNHMRDIQSGRLVVYTFKEIGPFRMAHAKNMAHRLAMREGCNILVNMDADNYAAYGFDLFVKESFDKSKDIFLWPDLDTIKINRGGKGSFKGLNGRIAVTQDAFLKIGGYDERFRAWSPDDKDFDARLRRLGYSREAIPEEFLNVVLHTNKMRFKEYPHVHNNVEEHQHPIIMESDHTVVNYGRFGMGCVYRNFSDEPIFLEPLPTRIFGIGWHKTATTSLHTALQQLGYDSAHWKSAPWAKHIWDEMNTFGKSLTLEKSYALSDLPIGPLYRVLDLSYPGSKFILTLRNEDKWLDSVRRHWNPETNPYRKQWESDHFSHRIHEILYGTREFNAESFLNRYRQHNAEVLQYFQYRPDDLLIMDMDNGAGWNQLCQFFHKPVPTEPYPVMFNNGSKIGS